MSSSRFLPRHRVGSRIRAVRAGLVGLVGAVGVWAGAASAQDVLLDIQGSVANADASNGIAIGDWDGDGVGDLAIGAPFDDTAAPYAGAVRIHSGRNGSVLATFLGTDSFGGFGFALARLPDLDGDGWDELAVAAPWADHGGSSTGSVFVHAGGSGALLLQIDGPATGYEFGRALGGLGDVDGDGVPDLFISLWVDDAVYLYSGATGQEIRHFTGAAGVQFGLAACALDDVDGDGVRDLLVGANMDGNTGSAYVISSATGAILRTHRGTQVGEYFGAGVTSITDLDGDGVRDYAVSTYWDWSNPERSSKVYIFSGASGTLVTTVVAPVKRVAFQPQIADAGDVNGDGVGDLAISGLWIDPGDIERGAAFLVSGRTFFILQETPTDGAYVVVAPAGDFDGDGRDDLIVGVSDGDLGSVRIDAGDDLWLDATPVEPVAGEILALATREGVAGAPTVLTLEDVDGVATFQIVGGLATFGPQGGRRVTGNVPPGLAGHQLTFRSYARGASGKVIASAAEVVDFE
jgi:hypothetical protein